MHWQNAILSSPSKRAARQNKYAIYVRYHDGSAVVMPKKHSGIRDAKSQEVEGFDDWVSLEEFEAAQQKMHPTWGESAASDSESKPAPKRVI